ncbi:Undecaprenyl-phosphate galactosephosphotransferase [Campylobacter concisus UNSWCD]|uniref:sugar transferase n=1 Tax=Campylobacter concisus TaxID=199 RepID=UPI00025A660B|nr:sugar transferase [Campylobacter concisus]EIF07168.1 Undecaprenyl-phosphate galactosephosphotransferase [Campylobacter concisus UNSWCD]
MKKQLCIMILLIVDILIMCFSLGLSTVLCDNLTSLETLKYQNFILFYMILIFLFFYQGIYTRRYDFWYETKMIVKSCFFGLLLSLSILALTRKDYDFLQVSIVLSFAFLIFLLPVSKFILKKALFNFKIWKKKARILGETSEFELEIFNNKYLGYVRAKGKDHDTLFIGNNRLNVQNLNELIERNIKENKEILFTPTLRGYDFTQAHIYNLFNSRTNIFAIQNSLQNNLNIILKRILDLLIAVIVSPFLIIVFSVIILIMKIIEPKGNIFFSQPRLGLNGRHFRCYKFRSMCMNQDFMSEWLKANPDEEEYYKVFKKYKNDPRVTKVGKILRKTSLDELPQILNVLKGEMSIVGPRPYLPSELPDLKEYVDIILSVKPGITGIWQVSGRSDVDFETRAQMDVWYMKNWCIWNDIVIIIKTFKVVLLRKGAS